MEDILTETAKQVPSLIVLAWIVSNNSKTVSTFLVALRDQREECTRIIKELSGSWRKGD